MDRLFSSRPAGLLAALTRKRFVSCLPACGWVLGWLLAPILGCGLLAGATPAKATPPPKALLIVAPRQLHPALTEFVRHKRRWLPTELAALETVLDDSTGVDAPERLKRFLYRAWRERQAGYVLLVGDGDVMPSGLGKQLVCGSPNGAVAYIGCNTGSQPCGLTLLEGFVVALLADSDPRLGDCWARAVSYYYDHERLAVLTPNSDWYPPSIFFQGMKFMLFGDPSLQLAAPAAAPR